MGDGTISPRDVLRVLAAANDLLELFRQYEPVPDLRLLPVAVL